MPTRPIAVNLNTQSLEDFQNLHAVDRVVDTTSEQLEELFLIRNPRFRFDKNYSEPLDAFRYQHEGKKNWFYFPWNELLVAYLPDEPHQELRTARNKNLIKAEEQKKFYSTPIGVAGLSVGSHAALTIAMMGGAKTIKLADPDGISGSNLNRIRGDFSLLGLNKCEAVARHIGQLDPYASVVTYTQGITAENIDEFLSGISILVEELDNLEMKILLREKARERGIPVIMATDNGDNIIIDVERYDLHRDLELFNGAAGPLSVEEFKKIPPHELPKLATKIAGPAFVVKRMMESLLEVGKTLYSWPQLGSAATLSGVAVAYAARKIAMGENIREGKYEVNLDAIFDPEYHEPAAKEARENARSKFLKTIGLE